MSTVSIPRWLLATIVAALALSLLVVAYLLGRESGRSVASEAPFRPSRPNRAQPATAPPASPAPVEPAAESVPAGHGSEAEAPALGPASAVESAAATATPVSPESRPVALYFARLDAIQIGDGGLSPEAGQAMLTAMLQGDASGFDRLVADAERAERDAAAVVPPPECASYHRSLLDLLHESRTLLADLRSAIGSEDKDEVFAIASRASALQQRAEQLRGQENELRRRHGVPRPE